MKYLRNCSNFMQNHACSWKIIFQFRESVGKIVIFVEIFERNNILLSIILFVGNIITF